MRAGTFALNMFDPQTSTHDDIALLAQRLCGEIRDAVELRPFHRMSFIGHSLGGLIVRALLDMGEFNELLSTRRLASFSIIERISCCDEMLCRIQLHTYMSLCGPHVGAVQSGGLLSAGA